MLKSHEKFHSTNGKRQILVADDEMVNREMLKAMLEDEYEVLLASDGEETVSLMTQFKSTLSLVLLDIQMPVKSGFDVLKEAKRDASLAKIPIIVTTAERQTELECLTLGAVDFVSKPYPAADVIRARLLRIIELSEDREIIQSTERDELTGLYNREYFYRYAEQYDQFHKETNMDAIIVDINHFRMINERYGKAYGDEILKKIGEQLREMVKDSGGIVCRREADTFMVYCPHRDDYEQILRSASVYLTGDQNTAENRVRLRMGVYADVDKDIDIERRFDRAKMAADRVKGSFTTLVGTYDSRLHEQELFAERLIVDFPAAIAEKQFKVFYQPKFDVRPDTPVLTSAEALVRWVHPELGMISPGVFIPLFEDNGLIQKLDTYVWEEAARQIREWKDRLNYSIPISVNVSRIDMYDNTLPETIEKITKSQNLSGKDLLLEVTESAYTQDSEQIIEMVKRLRSMGFKIEMDDFGIGYSSLNMISTLPIDTLKLDMHFIRDAFREGGNTHMLEVVIGIAGYLSVPVIAEGVETEEQLHALKALGCDIVQGYFFSKPVPADEFEPFILQKKEADIEASKNPEREPLATQAMKENEEHVRALKEDILKKRDAKESAKESEKPENFKEQSAIQLRTAMIFFLVLSIIAAVSLMISDLAVTKGYQRMAEASDRYIESQLAASNLELASDYLTDRVRCFVVTGDIKYLNDFYEEINVTKRRDNAVSNLGELLEGGDKTALDSLNKALELSNELVATENQAVRLMVAAGKYQDDSIPDDVKKIEMSSEDRALSSAALKNKAEALVFDSNYMYYKDRIRENVAQCTQSLIRASSKDLDEASDRLSFLVNLQTVLTVLFLLIMLGVVILITLMVRRPLSNMVLSMQKQEFIPPTGVEELRFVTRTYNQILEENQQAREKLSHEASHDALTGLFNRGAYDLLIESADTEHMALILIDVDYFKTVNDTYGHAVGDRVLKRVAEILKQSFRSVDILCRIGGDEFAVVMTRVNKSMGPLVINKINRANELLQHPSDDLPPVSLSVGVAFSDRDNPQGDIFKDADAALYRVKEAGRKGCAIY